jgi:RNA polymerase sigma factor (sigma-70 family)
VAPLLARTPSPERQFDRIYRKHAADVYRYVLVVLRNPQDAEDVTQTTFMNAYRAMQNGERPETPKNWLIAIAHNVCRQRFRQQMRRPLEVGLLEDAAEAAVQEEDGRYSVEDIQRAIGHLGFNQRSALVMRELEGRSYAEIGEIMDLSVSAVETLIFRARRALREQLEGSLTCNEAELLLSKQLDGQLQREDRGQLRAHLRQCGTCATVARKQRASRGALKALLGGLPVPTSVTSLFGGGSAAGLGMAAKTAAVVCAGAVVGTGGYEAATNVHPLARALHVSAKSAPQTLPTLPPTASARATAAHAAALKRQALKRQALKRQLARDVLERTAARTHGPKTHARNPVAAAAIPTKVPKLVPPGQLRPKHVGRGNGGADPNVDAAQPTPADPTADGTKPRGRNGTSGSPNATTHSSKPKIARGSQSSSRSSGQSSTPSSARTSARAHAHSLTTTTSTVSTPSDKRSHSENAPQKDEKSQALGTVDSSVDSSIESSDGAGATVTDAVDGETTSTTTTTMSTTTTTTTVAGHHRTTSGRPTGG